MQIVQATATAAIPYPTEARAKALDAIRAYLALLRGMSETRFAVAGDGAGNVNVSDRTKYVYARLGGTDGEVTEALNLLLANIGDGDTLLLQREQGRGLGGFLVVDWFGAGTIPVRFCSDGTCGGALAFAYHFVYDTRTYSGTPYNEVFGVALDGTIYAIASIGSDANTGDPELYMYAISVSGVPAITYTLTGTPHLNVRGFAIQDATATATLARTIGGSDYSFFDEFDVTPTSISGDYLDYYPGYLFGWNEAYRVGATNYRIVDYTKTSGEYGFLTNTIGGSDLQIGTGGQIDAWSYAANTVYAVDDAGEMLILDVSNPASMSVIATLSSACAHAADVRANGTAHVVWIADDSANEIVCIDVSTPASPSILSTVSLSNAPVALALCGNYLYAVCDNGNALAYDVTDASAPSVSGSTVTLSNFTPRARQTMVTAGILCVLGVETSTQYPCLCTLTTQ